MNSNFSEVDHSLSVVLPCYNERDNITDVSALRVLEAMRIDFEILLVNDGSSDGTGAIVDCLAQTDQRVKAVHHIRNLGYGAALRSGFATASKRLVFYTDSDGQFDIAELPRLLPLMTTSDIVSGFRIDRQDGLVRSLNAWCWTKLMCYLFRFDIKDINCAFKLYRREVFDKMKLRSNGAMINAEIFAHAVTHGYKISQVGVRHFPRVRGSRRERTFG